MMHQPFQDMSLTMQSMTPLGHHMMPPGFSSISDGGAMTAATSHNQSQFEETERKNKARIDLLEKKLRAKDQLFEDALSSTVAGSCACGGSGSENRSLTGELKKRFLKLKTKYVEAEEEISRLTKTVKVVEVEVSENTEPLKEEIRQLKDEKFDFSQKNALQTDQIND